MEQIRKAVHNKETSEYIVTVAAKAEQWKAEQEKAYDKLKSELVLKGFRKGQVPSELARKAISQQNIFTNALSKMVEILASEAVHVVPKDVMVLDAPAYQISKITDKELELTYIYPVYPEVKIKDYKTHGINYQVPAFSESELEAEIKRLVTRNSKLEPKTGELEHGDVAIFDFDGYVDGVAFDGGSAKDYELEIGSSQFIAGFEDQMIGMKPGDERHVVAQFPHDYPAQELSGKQAVFIVRLKSIKAHKMPHLTDDFVKTLKIDKVETLDELKAHLKKMQKDRHVQNARERFRNEVFAILRSRTSAKVPAGLVAREAQKEREMFENSLKRQGVNMADYWKMTGQTIDSAMVRFRADAERKLTDALIFAEISKHEKLDVTDADYDEAYKRFSVLYNQSPENMRNVISKAQLQIPLMNDKVIDFLIEHSHATAPAAHAPEAKHATDKKHAAEPKHTPDSKHGHEDHGHDHDHSAHGHNHDHSAHAKAEKHDKHHDEKAHKAEATKAHKAEATKAHKTEHTKTHTTSKKEATKETTIKHDKHK